MNSNNDNNNNPRIPLRVVYTTYNIIPSPPSNVNDDISLNLRNIIFNNFNRFEYLIDRNTETGNNTSFDEDITNIVNDTFYRSNVDQLSNVSNVSAPDNSNLTFEQVAFDFRFPTLELFENIFQDYIQNKNKLNEEEFNNNVDYIKDCDNSSSIECPICFEKYNDYINIKKCSHKFCENCIRKWLKDHKNTCPICRVEISTVIKNSISNNSLNSNGSNGSLTNLDSF